ncbi:MAG: tRNA (adenosine(37)-N6)-threonylcarbamoyltransferase complex ATPase subunit type 1 TsaE [Defluviitaleaceae bacterium]|nr:tRNA (adenosine(37)-N6)-threonylcarbamoyltransferase complex ATPase subunit type 1 TsaE [Defluviitaleaceae bacterium]
MEEHHSYNPLATYEFAYNLAKTAKKREIYTLSGDLGVGKTVFAQGFASGLDISDNVVSPTFTILNIYEGSLPLYHFDMYRIEDLDELVNIGHEEYFYGDGICLIEWPEMVIKEIPSNAINIKITKSPEKGDDYRRIAITR